MSSRHSGTEHRYPELERLICVAISNQQFAAQLVQAPERALENAEFGLQLSPSERALVTSITDAIDIHDFAARLRAKVLHPSDHE